MDASESKVLYDTPVGITNPPIDELLERVSSKYALVDIVSKRARQITEYYNQLSYGMMDFVGPLVEVESFEKPLSIAMREVHSDVLQYNYK